MSRADDTLPRGGDQTAWLHVQLGRILGGLEEVQRDTSEMRAAQTAFQGEVAGLSSKLDGISDRLADVEKPVGQFVTMRNNLTGGLLVFSAFGGVAAYFREWIIAHLFGRP